MALVALKYHQSGTAGAWHRDLPAQGTLGPRITILRIHVRSKGTKNTFPRSTDAVAYTRQNLRERSRVAQFHTFTLQNIWH